MAKLTLNNEELEELKALSRSNTAEARKVRRARILVRYHSGESVSAIAEEVRMTRTSVRKWIVRALGAGPKAALQDAYHRPHDPVITEEAKAWVISVACTKPKELGYAAELWTRSALANHIRSHAVENGHPSLSKAAKATVHRILAANKLHPEKIKYFLEKRDPDFDEKRKNILLVYRAVAMQNEARLDNPQEGPPAVVTVSVDEKPGVQAIGNTAPDRPPVPGKYGNTGRDHEYKRFGTCSILAALDLHDGHITARVEKKHRSVEFIALLNDLDAYYPPQCNIRIILDNHSAHLSKQTHEYLATKPNRFHYVLTPKHGSWLNIVETLFGKMARTFLKHIRVQSWQELRERILMGIAEINAQPVVHRWGKFEPLDEVIF